MSVSVLLLVPRWRRPGPMRRRRPIAVVEDTLADDVLLWHLDEDGWD